jgi:hypothetical protein
MELFSGPKIANGVCGKTIKTVTIDRGSTVFVYHLSIGLIYFLEKLGIFAVRCN